MINNECAPYVTTISSGSLAEGMDLPGSDVDVMRILTDVHVVQNIQHIKSSFQYTSLLMETGYFDPGFIRLKLVSGGETESKIITSHTFVETSEGIYLSAKLFMDSIVKQIFPVSKVALHGPCISDINQALDFAYCLRVTSWPEVAKQWMTFVILPPKWKDGFRALALVESLRKDEASSLILSLLERFHDNVNKHIVQLSPPVSTLNTKTNFRRYSKHLKDTVKTEPVSAEQEANTASSKKDQTISRKETPSSKDQKGQLKTGIFYMSAQLQQSPYRTLEINLEFGLPVNRQGPNNHLPKSQDLRLPSKEEIEKLALARTRAKNQPADSMGCQTSKSKHSSILNQLYGMLHNQLAKNKLASMMSRISEEAGLSIRYTNHCLRATVATGLKRAGVDDRAVMSVTGHRNVKSLDSYIEGPTDKQRESFPIHFSELQPIIQILL
ncbi:unnamed protein product [Mytilus coruscus]|uniref:Tyr recombinase domain-containing protein n=1 Tax=Mytilus coruscus TaxID=42192 RepID=A0A6J8C5W0_MYTCO|nr:unnamed protein product [Mytilus coruscus]